jgi:hypothetical protein
LSTNLLRRSNVPSWPKPVPHDNGLSSTQKRFTPTLFATHTRLFPSCKPPWLNGFHCVLGCRALLRVRRAQFGLQICASQWVRHFRYSSLRHRVAQTIRVAPWRHPPVGSGLSAMVSGKQPHQPARSERVYSHLGRRAIWCQNGAISTHAKAWLELFRSRKRWSLSFRRPALLIHKSTIATKPTFST